MRLHLNGDLIMIETNREVAKQLLNPYRQIELFADLANECESAINFIQTGSDGTFLMPLNSCYEISEGDGKSVQELCPGMD